MTVYSKFNIIYRLQKWLDSVPGQTFMNYAYSWGASIVILGTLFKLTHLPGANFMLFLGMGTEVVVFFIAAFDRPFDKTTDGMDLPTHVEDGETEAPLSSPEGDTMAAATVAGGMQGGGTVIIGGGAGVGGVVGNGEETARWEGGAPITFAGGGVIGGGTIEAPSGAVGGALGDELKDATSNYIDELNHLSEMLKQVSEQSQRLTSDSEEMENLNRTLTGISRVYEMQLKSASQQIGTIEEIDAQTRHLAEQIVELNKIYARMIEAMQVRTSSPLS